MCRRRSRSMRSKNEHAGGVMITRAQYASFVSIFFLAFSSFAAPPAMLDEPSKRQTQRIQYVKHIVKEAYEASAQKDGKWDKPAGLAIDLLAINLSNDPLGEGDESRIMYFRAGDALTAGWDDPLVHFRRGQLVNQGPGRNVQAGQGAL